MSKRVSKFDRLNNNAMLCKTPRGPIALPGVLYIGDCVRNVCGCGLLRTYMQVTTCKTPRSWIAEWNNKYPHNAIPCPRCGRKTGRYISKKKNETVPDAGETVAYLRGIGYAGEIILFSEEVKRG